MKSKAYWINRAIDRQSTIDRLSQAELDEIRKIYDAAQRDLTRMINEIYETYSRKTGIDVSELKKLLSYSETDKFWKSLDGKNMKQYVMNNYKSRITRLEQIQAKLQEKCNDLASKQERAMRIAGKNAIRSSFSKTVYDTSIGIDTDLGFVTLDDRTINTILKEKWLGSNYSERVWKNTDLLAKNVQSILTRTVMSGASQSRAIMELRDRMSVEWYKAERLVRTEMNHFHNQAELEAYEEMGVEKYVYVATLDNRTSEICQELDGKIFKLSEAQEGVNYPPMHPFCRSTVRAFISEEVEKSLKRRARDEEGNNTVIENMSYSEWMESRRNQSNSADTGKTTEFVSSFVPASTIEEAEKYAERFVDKNTFGGSLGLSYKGLSVESANTINKTLSVFYEQYDVEKLSSIVPCRKNTRIYNRIFKDDSAYMAASRASRTLYINVNPCKNPKSVEESLAIVHTATKNYIADPSKTAKYSDDLIRFLNTCIKSGRDTVPENLTEAVYHEMGHMMEKQIGESGMYNDIVSGFNSYSELISGYAQENIHEYIAESFVSYMKGENRIDETLKKAFDSLRR